MRNQLNAPDVPKRNVNKTLRNEHSMRCDVTDVEIKLYSFIYGSRALNKYRLFGYGASIGWKGGD